MNQTDIARGQRAKRLLEDDLLTESFDTIRANLLQMFEASTSADKEAREDIWKQLNALKSVRRHLESVMNTGKLAEAESAQKEREGRLKQERLKRIHPYHAKS